MPLRRLLILGAGGFGREVWQYASDCGQFEVVGFLDDDPTDERTVGSAHDADKHPGCSFVIAVGDPRTRMELGQRVLKVGGHLASIVHPTAYVAPDALVGEGSILAPFSMVGVRGKVGANCALNLYASVGHDAVLNDHGVLSPYSTLNGHAVVGEGGFLGTHAAVAPGVVIGGWSKISSGTVGSHNVEAGSLIAGAPARSRQMFDIPTTPHG
jgi:sugar O-acyltransferase (sialic acid O-acetyltransferase NeuD family)